MRGIDLLRAWEFRGISMNASRCVRGVGVNGNIIVSVSQTRKDISLLWIIYMIRQKERMGNNQNNLDKVIVSYIYHIGNYFLHRSWAFMTLHQIFVPFASHIFKVSIKYTRLLNSEKKLRYYSRINLIYSIMKTLSLICMLIKLRKHEINMISLSLFF